VRAARPMQACISAPGIKAESLRRLFQSARVAQRIRGGIFFDFECAPDFRLTSKADIRFQPNI
jgi:hypothetical protein